MKQPVLKFPKGGFTLIEILVFISVFSVALISLVGTVSYSALIMSNARYRVMATRYSEEVAEWLKFQREFTNFDTIYGKSAVAPGKTYCFDTLNIDTTWPVEAVGGCTGYPLNNFFKRSLVLTALAANKISAQISTSYQFLNLVRGVTINVSFNDYE